MVGIYRIINPNGAVYIGQSWNIEQRLKYYCSLSCKNQVKLYNSLAKYGIDNHTFEILKECNYTTPDKQFFLDQLEYFFWDAQR